MEEKESTVSGSLAGNSDTDSPPPISSLHVAHPPHHHHQQQLPMSSVTPSPANDVVSPPNDFLTKKKRGRPRKYDSDGNLRVKPASFHHHHHPNNNNNNSAAPPPGFYISQYATSAGDYGHDQQQRRTALASARRGRGRSGGSGSSWQVLASLGELFANTAGGDFTPHVLTVNTGEDVAGKIMSVSQKGSRGICVLSANGAVSNVTIRQPSSSGGILTYEGRYEILSLTGSYTAADNQNNGGSTRNRTGGLSVSLASSDGRVIGGGVAGLLLAASPTQVVVGSFKPNGYKVHKRKYNREQHSPAMSQPANVAVPATAAQVGFTIQPLVSPPPTTTMTGSSLPGQSSHSNAAGAEQQAHNSKVDDGRQTTTFHHPMNNNSHDHHGGWNGTVNSSSSSIHRPSPVINVSAPSDDDVPAVSGVF